jgi:hypothetical protein
LKTTNLSINLSKISHSQAVVRALLEKKLPDAFKHIRSLRDVFDVHLQANPDESTAEESPWICPVSLVAVGVRPFVAIVPCGHVVSLRALSELSGAPTCPQCSEPMRSSSRLSLPKAEYDLAQTALLNTIEAEKAQKAALKAAKRSAVALDDANSDRPDTDVKKSRKSAVTSTAPILATTGTVAASSSSSSSTVNSATKAFSTESAAFKSLFTSATRAGE